MNKEFIHARWKAFWETLGIRHLGAPPEEFIPTAKDRCEYGFTHGYLDGYKEGEAEGRLHAYEISVGILYHAYQVNKRHHGKDSEMALLLKNQILEIREAQAKEMEA